MAYKQGTSVQAGVLLIRMQPRDKATYIRRIVDAVNGLPSTEGWFFVLDEKQLRARPLP